ncbi:MAG: hypothetical protein ACOC9D_03450 [Thermodesulfobacteriota bacterium]
MKDGTIQNRQPEGLVPLPDLVRVFSGRLFTRRLDQDYVSRLHEYIQEFAQAVGKKGTFWQLAGT